MRKHGEMQNPESFPLCKVTGADGAVTTINLFTLSLLSKWLWLSVIKALNTLKLFYSHSQDLHSRPGFNSFKGKHQMSLRSSIHSLGRCLFFIWLLEEDFTICNALNWTTQPIANLNSTIRWWMRFRQHLQKLRTSYHSWFVLVATTSHTPIG